MDEHTIIIHHLFGVFNPVEESARQIGSYIWGFRVGFLFVNPPFRVTSWAGAGRYQLAKGHGFVSYVRYETNPLTFHCADCLRGVLIMGL